MTGTSPGGGVWAVVVAAGTGTRFGARKQYEALGGQRVLDWAVSACRAVADSIVLVVPAEKAADPEPTVDAVVSGGPTRSESVRRGLAAVSPEATVVVVHDAARPLAARALFGAVVAAVQGGADAAVPALPVVDTVKRVRDDGRVVETLDRSGLVLVQTPQAFAPGPLRAAHALGDEATDDAALVESRGGLVVVVPGDPGNAKVTTPHDLASARALVGP